MRVTTGSLEVLESGVVDSLGMNDIDCVLMEHPRLATTFRVRKTEGEQPAIHWQLEADDRLVITLDNPPLNAGPERPLEIGRLQDRRLHISFRVSVFGDYRSFQVSFTFYLGEAVSAA